MNLPAGTFAAIAPPPDGLVLAFTAARRRRNSKAAVSAFGGAVAIACALSLLAPPGQSLVQEPTPPAHGVLLPGLPDAPRHGAPTPVLRTPTAVPQVLRPVTTSRQTIQLTPAAVRHTRAADPQPSCGKRMLACIVVPQAAPGAPTLRASVCPSAATVTVEEESPPVGPTRFSASRTVEVGSCTA
jgi:hypothetical protein